ncbi:tail fiber protein [Metapseudomonas lalkuanensis]|uniref:Tail fiber protein n=2 Tax=Metapseudomonas lalkuanensis TaxID=2604832 RepID=A0A5J6QYJ5_9GAMM|nr:tail fiber protein [Pseudomonas lalkuanensis]
MAFHRVGNYALFLGLDVDNKLKIGGWSMGARAYELVHEGNSHLFTGAPGQVAAFAGALPPAGWLKANGAAVSRATYARLFAAIGTFYGEGDGKSTFNLPDLRGEFIRGWDDARGLDTNRALGSIQAPMLGSHGHTATAAIDGAHAHTISGSAAGVSTSYLSQVRQVAGGAAAAIGIPTLGESAAGVMVDGHSISGPYALRFTNSPMAHAHDVGGTAIAAGAHSHAITVNANGGHETRPRNVALLHCIKY